MITGIEIHDSTLAEVARDGRDVALRLRPAIVHRSGGLTGIDHTVWLQDVDLVISEAAFEDPPTTLPVHLDDGTLTIGENRLVDLIPLPMDQSGEISFWAVTINGDHLTIRGTRVKAVARGAMEYLEEFPGEAD